MSARLFVQAQSGDGLAYCRGFERAESTVMSKVRVLLPLSRLIFALVSFGVMVAPYASNADSRDPSAVLSRTRPKIVNADAFMRAHTPRAPRPDTIQAPAMPHTPVKAAREMIRRTPQSEISGLAWTQIPGAAS
jgi:hypothetical protein